MKNRKLLFRLAAGLMLFALALSSCSTTAQVPQATPASGASAVELPAAASPVVAPSATPTEARAPMGGELTPVAELYPQPVVAELPAALASRLGSAAMETLTSLLQEASPRASGTQQEKDAAEYVLQQLSGLGYRTGLQPFEVDITESQVMVGPGAQEFVNFPLRLSGTGDLTAALVDVGSAFEVDIPAAGLAGKVALIKRGEITFEEKVTRVADAGALGAIIYNNVDGEFRGTLTNQAAIPAISISRDSGETILKLIADGQVDVTVLVKVEPQASQNVIAEKQGTEGASTIIIFGGHYDTVSEVPGANDNGSGIATLITIAREVSKKSYPFTLRFVAFGAEELGVVGSQIMLQSLGPEERAALKLMVNFDALGSGSSLVLRGDSDLVTQVLEYGQSNGIPAQPGSPQPDLSSDHAPFQQDGIPVLFFSSGDFSRIHTAEDKIEFVQAELLGNSAALAIGLLDSLAAR